MSTKPIQLTVQQWGNSLAIRIPASIAKHAHFEIGTPVEIEAQEVGFTLKPIGQRQLTLNERLKLFDPKKHSGESMVTHLIGKENFNAQK